MTTPPEQRLREAFTRYSVRVLAYALRHTDPSSAHDVVADVFLVAWRRIDVMPDDPLPWLLVVARNTLHNRRRSSVRRHQLTEALAGLERAVATAPGADDLAVERDAMLHALADLSTAEREAVLLTSWDGLSAVDASRVAGCSTHAFEVRLHRARRRLRRLLPDAAEDPDPTPAPATRVRLAKGIAR